MYPKHFVESFWESEQKNQLFALMPFDDYVEKKFEIIDKAAKKIGFEKGFRVGIETEANSINDRILDGIANSKMIIADLSDDSRTGDTSLNVMYELGIANAIREPFDIVIYAIGKNPEKILKLPFDIRNLHINFEKELSEEFIQKIVSSAMKNQEWHKSKRVKVAAESIDENGLALMNKIGWWPTGYNHFNSKGYPAEMRMSLLRLIDLGIVRFACESYKGHSGFEYAYHWTPFGYAVMKYLGIEQITEEEFEKRSEYPEAVKQRDTFFESKKKILGEPNNQQNH